jgi:dienelactone hydrolase
MPATNRAASRASILGWIVVAVLLVTAAVSCRADVATDGGSSSPSGPRGSGATAPPPHGSSPGSVPGSIAGTIQPAVTAVVAPPSTTTTGKAAPTTSSRPPTTAPATRGQLPVSTTSVALVDSSRPTVSHGRQVAATRTLTTTVTYPTGGGRYPLVVFAHGFQLGPSNYTQIMRAIAAGGYVVAAPSFPLADAAVAGNNLDRGDIPNQSGDLSFVITQLTGNPPPELAGTIDGSRVGAVGHSDGADTVLDLGYYPGRTDARVKAVAALSPDAMSGPGGSVGSAPLLITHGDHDSIVPFANATTVFSQVHAHRFLLTLIGGDHLPPVQGAAPWAAVLDEAVLDLLDHDVAGATGSDQALLEEADVPGVASLQQAG